MPQWPHTIINHDVVKTVLGQSLVRLGQNVAMTNTSNLIVAPSTAWPFTAEAGRGEAMHLFRGLVFRETDSCRGTGGSDQGPFHQARRGGEGVSLFLFNMCKKACQDPDSVSSVDYR